MTKGKGEYSKDDEKELLKLARESIKEQFNNKKPSIPKDEKFQEKRGVFVTLTKSGNLRGCIGFPYPILPINGAIYNSAKSAAFEDSRFPQLSEEELNKIKIEISLLTLPEECKSDDIEIGKDGLICNYSGYSGLLLPQVATEYKMNKTEFLECLCNKAGLPKDAWKQNGKGFKLYKFQAQIFKE